MLSSIGRLINNNISETGEYITIDGISETGLDNTIGNFLIYEYTSQCDIVIPSTDTDIQSGFVIFEGPIYSISPTGAIVIPEIISKNTIYGKYKWNSFGRINYSSRSTTSMKFWTVHNYIKTDYTRIIRDNPALSGSIDYNTIFKYNLSEIPTGCLVIGYNKTPAGTVISSSQIVVRGKSTIFMKFNVLPIDNTLIINNDIATEIKILYQLHSKVNIVTSSIVDILKISSYTSNGGFRVGSSKSLINVIKYINSISAFNIGTDINEIYLGGAGYSVKSTLNLIASSDTKYSKSTLLNIITSIAVTGTSNQVFIEKGKRPLSINNYPFISTNGLDDIAAYFGISRIQGETNNVFYQRIKRLSKIRYGQDYITSILSLNEQLGEKAEPLIKISCELPYTIDILDEKIDIKIFNNDGTLKKFTSIFINVQTILDEDNNLVYSPLKKFINRISNIEELKVTILNTSYENVSKDNILRNKNYRFNNDNIITKKRSIIKFNNSNSCILPNTLIDDNGYLISRVNSIAEIIKSNQFYFDDKTNYLELGIQSPKPTLVTFTEVNKDFIIYKVPINLLTIDLYVKYGMSDNFINILFELLNNKIISG